MLNYIEYIKNAMIVTAAHRYDIKGKRLLSSQEKYYAVDLGLRNTAASSDKTDFNKLYENIVYLELLARGYTVTVGKNGTITRSISSHSKTTRGSICKFCYLLASEQTIDREFGNLERIDDNYPKS